MLVRFEPLPPEFPAARMALFWERVRKDLPNLQAAPPAEVPIEKFDGSNAGAITFEFGFSTAPAQRLFFVSEGQEHLIQVQSDHFGRNWRKLAADATYPHYTEFLRARFEEDLRAFFAFLRDEGLKGHPVPAQCEMIYINHIAADGAWSVHSDFPKIFTCTSAPAMPEGLAPEELSYLLRSQFRGEDGQRGRLHASIEPRFRSGDGVPLYVLTLTARGAPKSADIADVMTFFDQSREAIVRTFAALTTRDMHDQWERYQ